MPTYYHLITYPLLTRQPRRTVYTSASAYTSVLYARANHVTHAYMWGALSYWGVGLRQFFLANAQP